MKAHVTSSARLIKQEGVFGVLFAITKDGQGASEARESASAETFRFLLSTSAEFIQAVAFLIDPSFGWTAFAWNDGIWNFVNMYL